MPSTVEKLGPSRVKLTIEIPFADLKPHLDKAYRDIASQVNIPGFRKGKVPPTVIDRRFGRGTVLQDAINEALPDAYSQAVAEHELVPLGQPDIDVTSLEDGQRVEFTAELDVRPEFEVPAFSELKGEVPVLSPADEQVDERIELMRQRFATRLDKDDAAESGDVVTIDLVASADGEEIPDGTASGLTYKIGSGGMLEGLDDAVTGLSAGETATFTSELVGGAAKGTAAEVQVTVVKVQTETLPEVDDEFAQLISEFDTVEEMRADLAEAVVRMARLEQASAARDAVISDLVAKTPFELPEAMVATEIASRRQQVTEQLARAGYTIDRYLEESDDETAGTPEEFWAQLSESATTSLKAQVILDKLADDREVGVEQSELTEMIFRKARANNTSPEQEMQHMMEHNHAAEWMSEIRRGKVLDQIVAEASVTDAAGAVVAVGAVQPDGSLAEESEGSVEPDAEVADAAASDAGPVEEPAKKKASKKKAADQE